MLWTKPYETGTAEINERHGQLLARAGIFPNQRSRNRHKPLPLSILIILFSMVFLLWDAGAARAEPDTSWYVEGQAAFTISNADQLAGLANLVNEGKDYFSGKTISLDRDISLTGSWTPIGVYSQHPEDRRPFLGTFNGGDKKITGLIISRPETGYAGLFGYIGERANIFNVDIQNVNVSGSDNVGALAGVSEGSITNCRVTNGSVIGNNNVGALIGISEGNITNCRVTTGTVHGNNNVGGLTGVSKCNIVSCQVTGGSVIGNDEVGGLIGFIDRSVEVSSSNASASVIGRNSVGGLIGSAGDKTNIRACQARGSVTGRDDVGGLIGRNSSGSVTNCQAYGNVVGHSKVGKLIGYNAKGSVRNSSGRGTATGDGQWVGEDIGRNDNFFGTDGGCNAGANGISAASAAALYLLRRRGGMKKLRR